ncbi:hydrolase [Spiroplasma helicoides]|uniref:Hydrolase n=1 Tax=Spiroplasma helicoides TaxID=216938 RepID=A0A1B3SL57_9MOLU|nr:alpha/beta fold hydrolase [Spiroplasma helicoides]AOG60662.1 hydrolase [Spiroplasma helicoides]
MKKVIVDKLIKIINSTKAGNANFYTTYGWEQLLNLYKDSLTSEYNLDPISFDNFENWKKVIVDNRIHAIYHLNKVKTNKWIIGCHGYSSSKESSALSSWFLENLGYNIMVFDFINHGESDEGLVTFGVHELDALTKVVNYLHSNFKVKEMGLIGFSMGAFTVNLFSLFDKKIIKKSKLKFVISDSSYMDIKLIFKKILNFTTDPIQKYVESLMDEVIKKYRKDFNIDVLKYDIVKLIEINKKTVPVLYIHSKKDLVTYYKDSEKLYELRKAISKKDKLLLFDNGPHVQTQLKHTKQYIEAVKDFLKNI